MMNPTYNQNQAQASAFVESIAKALLAAMNLDNGTAQENQQPLATPKPMTMMVKDVAYELNTSTQTVRAMIHRNELPAFKVGKNFVVNRAEFERWVKNQTLAQGGTHIEAS